MHNFFLSDSASARIKQLSVGKVKTLRFRISVKGGGCSGFQYEFALDEDLPSSDDIVFSNGGAEVIIDEVSISMLEGSMLDYTEDLSGAGFAIKNPNATAKCGCGNSFSVAL